MKEKQAIKFLRIPLYAVLFCKNIDDKSIDQIIRPHFGDSLIKTYSLEERKSLFEALQWALQNKDYRFNKLLPGLEHHSNESLLFYFKKLSHRIEEQHLAQ